MDPKDMMEKLEKALTDFRAEHSKEIAEIKAKGSATAETLAGVDKASKSITALETQLEEQRKQIKELETIQARLALSPKDVKDQTHEHATAFFAMVHAERDPKNPAPIPSDAVEQYKAYKSAFNAYLRRGAAITPAIQAALSVGADPAGGWWVTPDTSGKIAKLVFESSPVRQYADVQTIGTDRLIGFNDLDEDDSGSGWVGETTARPETGTPEIGKYEIPVHEEYANPRVTQTLLDDAQFDVEGWLAGKVSARLARRQNNAFVIGNGVGKPAGFLEAGLLSASAPTKAAWRRIEYTGTGASGAFAAAPNGGDVFIAALGLLKEAYLPGAIWMMTRGTKALARKLKDSNGHYILLPDFRDGFRETALGLPVVGFEDMAAVGANSYSIAVGNLKVAYQIVDRQGIRVIRDNLTAKPWVQFYTTQRVGGDVVNFEALKAIKFI